MTANSDSAGPSVLQARTIRRVALRIVPFLMVCYFVSFLDRVNVGFAALQMVNDLHMSPAVFGFGSGVFFVSYFLCEVPSNLILQKVGARLWIALADPVVPHGPLTLGAVGNCGLLGLLLLGHVTWTA